MIARADAVDLFAGPGGWSVAVHDLGMTEVGLENDADACRTRRAAGFRTMETDILRVAPQLFRGTPGLIASPPCQTFSRAGGGAGRRQLDLVVRAIGRMHQGEWPAEEVAATSDPRTALVLQPLRWALLMEPEWIALEQVTSVLPVWEATATVLRERGYSVVTGNAHAETWGVPQTRSRAVLLARRSGPVAFPAATHSRFHNRTPEKLDNGREPWVSMAEALKWGEDPERPDIWFCPTNLRPHAALRHWSTPAPTLTFGHERPRWVTPTELAAYRQRVAITAGRRVNNQSGTTFDLSWPAQRPCPTIAGRELVGMPGANANRFNGSTKSRNDGLKLEPREGAILQTFPADFPWAGGISKVWEQIGNAIPPVMAKALLGAVL